MKNKSWMLGPLVFAAMTFVFIALWLFISPETLVRNFDNNGRSPFELLTLLFYLAIVPLVFVCNPFKSKIMPYVVAVVVMTAIFKQLDLHNALLHLLYPEIVNDAGYIPPEAGLVKPNGNALTGTPFKMRVITNAAVSLGMKSIIILYFGLLFGLFAVGFAAYFKKWLAGVFKLDGTSWAWGSFGAAGVFVQLADRIPSWLDHRFGLSKAAVDGAVSSAQSLCTALEEGSELTMAVLAILTICLGYRKLKNSK
jgi:hypothetical protein